jgi:hypothetical protein
MPERFHVDEIARRAAWSQAQAYRKREDSRERDDRRRKVNRILRSKVTGAPVWSLVVADLTVGVVLLVDWLV